MPAKKKVVKRNERTSKAVAKEAAIILGITKKVSQPQRHSIVLHTTAKQTSSPAQTGTQACPQNRWLRTDPTLRLGRSGAARATRGSSYRGGTKEVT